METRFEITRRLMIILLFCFSSCAFSGDRDIPLNVIGKSVDMLQKEYALNFEEIQYPVGQDTSATKVAWSIKYDNGHSIVVMDNNNNQIIDAIAISDEFFETENDVRVGDRLDEVMSAYPDADFCGDFNSPNLVTVYANDGRIEFNFDTSGISLEKIIEQGGFSVESEEIAAAPVWRIYIEGASN